MNWNVKRTKRGRDWPIFFKKENISFLPSTPAWQRPRIHFNYVNEWRCRIKQVKSRLLWQCGQIWRNFAKTFASFCVHLGNFSLLKSVKELKIIYASGHTGYLTASKRPARPSSLFSVLFIQNNSIFLTTFILMQQNSLSPLLDLVEYS